MQLPSDVYKEVFNWVRHAHKVRHDWSTAISPPQPIAIMEVIKEDTKKIKWGLTNLNMY